MKVYLDKDSVYPVFSADKKRWWSGNIEVELTDKEWKQVKHAAKAFDKAQDLLETKYNEAKL